jgi:lysophospholipase L1-like esterase
VTYGLFGRTNYDDNKSGCMRLNHAYGVQLRDGLSGKTTKEVKSGTFTFAACSGAKLVDLAQEGSPAQLNQAQKDTHFVTMQAGGNDAGFYAVSRDCIFHRVVNMRP